MHENVMVSVIVPVYNQEDYLNVSIPSILNQTYSNIEVVIVNDGSTDQSANIIKKYEKIDRRIKVITKKNGGLVSASVTGVRNSEGKYICFLDPDDYYGKNFIKTMLQLGKCHDIIRVVDDQIGSPTYTYDLARLLVDMTESEHYGRYHATNEGFCSWYEFACEIFKQAGMTEVKVTPVDSSQFPAKAKRPMNSRMDKSKLAANGFEPLPAWQDALGRYLKEIL